MNEVRDKMKAGTAPPSMAMYGLEKQEEFGLTDEEAAYTLSAPWAAGVDTVCVQSIYYFLKVDLPTCTIVSVRLPILFISS
jgi:hypothetical protein